LEKGEGKQRRSRLSRHFPSSINKTVIDSIVLLKYKLDARIGKEIKICTPSPFSKERAG
jgi:hypothetical protein